MNVKSNDVMGKRILYYPGSKWNIADRIVNLLPEHHSYVEPYFGSGAVLFRKPASHIETVNDLDDEVTNLFHCIQEYPADLADLVMTTPYSRKIYDRHSSMAALGATKGMDELQKALSFLVRCWQGHGFRTSGRAAGWKSDVQGREKMYALWDWYDLPEDILQTAERLRKVQIENRPALDVIRRFNHENVCMYVDPPYLLSERSGKQYKHEMTEEDHVELLETLLDSKAKILISGYDNDLYNDYLKGWEKRQFASCAEHGKKRIETVWMNYRDAQLTLADLFDI